MTCGLYLRTYRAEDSRGLQRGPETVLEPGAEALLTWKIEETQGEPVAEIGVEIRSDRRASGTVYLDYLTWDGAPDVTLTPPFTSGSARDLGTWGWTRAWVDAVDHVWFGEGIRISQDRGTGLLIQGTREWTDYEACATIRPHLARRTGLAVRVQGLQRYYAALLCDDQTLRLVKVLDGETVLAEAPYPWMHDQPYAMRVRVQGDRLQAWVDDVLVLEADDADPSLEGGAIALVCDVGRIDIDGVAVHPIQE